LFFCANCLWSICCLSSSSRNGCPTVGISRPSQRDVPRDICPIFHSRGSRSRVVAESTEYGEPVFTLIDVLLYIVSL
jgi:hypothetical protein